MAQELSCDAPGQLMDKTKKLLDADKRSLMTIHNGSNIPYFWLKTFARGGYSNPSVNRVETLYAYLTGTSLKV